MKKEDNILARAARLVKDMRCGKPSCKGCRYDEDVTGVYCLRARYEDAVVLIEDMSARIAELEKVVGDLRSLGYPHNFQREASYIVDYMKKISRVINGAFEIGKEV